MTTENSGKKLSKEELAFNKTLEQLGEIVGGKDNLVLKKAVPMSIMQQIAADLLVEERENLTKGIKEKVSSLLKGYATLKSEIAKKKDELRKHEDAKMKEFTESAKSLFALVEDFGKKEKEFTEGLEAAVQTANPAAGEGPQQ